MRPAPVVMARLYPNKGFTKMVEEVLAPYIVHPDLSDIADFEEAPREAVLEAAKHLPEEQLEDGHNLAPALREFLDDPLAVAYSGYIVREVRDDERLSINAVYYPVSFEGLKRALEVAHAYAADELAEVVLKDGTRAVMLWWD